MYQIYAITNRVNGKVYIGKTCLGLNRRWNAHVSVALNPKVRRWKSAISDAIRKHSPQAFFIREIDRVNDKARADETEKYWIATIGSFGSNHGYNLTEGGDGGGYQHTPEAKAKIGNAHRGRKHTEEFKKRNSEARKGKRVGSANHNYGKPMLPQVRKALMAARAAYVPSEEARKVLSQKLTGHPVSQETREKLRAMFAGRTYSEETIQKMSAGQKRRFHPPISRTN